MTRHLLIVPSLACPARCSYCFGPNQGKTRMDERALKRTAEWLSALSGDGETLEVTFHGGEPLTAGYQFYQRALPLLMHSWPGKHVRFNLQSNLWLLDEAFLELFSGFPVSLGTSLDGPEEINDSQRGTGYFRRTMQGIEKARWYGVPVGVIATFTAQSAQRWREVAEFFAREGLSFSVHAALPALGVDSAKQPWVLPPSAYGNLMESLLDYYLENLRRVRIATLDAMIRSVARGKGGMCTFGNCLGGYLAVDPVGGVYPCQRFVGIADFRMRSVEEPRQMLEASPVWAEMANRETRVDVVCGECEFVDICRGGCPYNVLASGRKEEIRDPYCEAYRRIFQKIVTLGTEEFFRPEHLHSIVEASPKPEQTLPTGGILDLMNGKPHPFEVAQNAGQVLGAVALAASGSANEAAERLYRAGLVREPARTLQALKLLKRRLSEQENPLNNLYLHVTFDCPLHCSHCYANGGRWEGGGFPAEEVGKQALEAGRLGFRHLVITGGEPLVHPQIEPILTTLKKVGRAVRPLQTVLRTSLVVSLDEAMLKLLAECVDEVVISLDGDPTVHDQRRGKGSYDRTVANLRRLVEVGGRAEISLAAVLPLAQAQGGPGQHVRALARELGIRRVRMRPLLPLGRAVNVPHVEAEVVWGHLTPDERIAYGFTPAASCGIGQNLYVEPDGTAYPCYAWHASAWALGNILEDGGLEQIVRGDRFRQLRQATVDTREGCKRCVYRYLCGGACRAWGRAREEAQVDLNQAAGDCAQLRERARGMVISALKYLEISTDRWKQAGLPLD